RRRPAPCLLSPNLRKAPVRKTRSAMLLAATLLLAVAPARAGGGLPPIFADGFESEAITPLFQDANGNWQLPPGPIASQFDWLLSELATGETTTIAEVNEHFDPGWLAQFNATQTVNFIAAIRSSY